MVVSRASGHTVGKLSKQTLQSSRSVIYRRTWRPIQRRTYASAGEGGSHGTHKSSSDLPWAIASIGFTVPATWYLIQPQLQPKKSHGHGHGHGDEEHSEHALSEDKSEDTAADAAAETAGDDAESGDKQEQSGDGGEASESSHKESSEEGKGDENGSSGDDKNSPDSGGAKKAPLTPGDHGSDDTAHEMEEGAGVEGVQFKGATSGGTRDGEQGDTKKHIPDAKGGNKKRLESHSAITLGEAAEPEQDHDNEDMGAASKSAGGAGSSTTQSSKQEGLSNTNTKHSTDIQNDPGKSKKGEGMPETAKLKGTVDPYRKQPEEENQSG